VIGAGTMGRGIAAAALLAGQSAILYDNSDQALAEARQRVFGILDRAAAAGNLGAGAAGDARARLLLAADLNTASKAELIVEAVPEVLELKRDLLARLGELAPPHAILASNTSSLSINTLAAASGRPERFLGLHFFNPAQAMQLVEVIPADDTSAEAEAKALEFVSALGKTPVRCKDTPGFIVNRIARPFYGEALRLLGESAATVETIDRLMRSAGFRMGPFELIDLVGCDVNLAVTQSVYEATFGDPRYRPHPIQRRMVESGRLGRKSGRGFYRYEK
jgi:3-hydroxybutyryl-CoA dehydrogenase